MCQNLHPAMIKALPRYLFRIELENYFELDFFLLDISCPIRISFRCVESGPYWWEVEVAAPVTPRVQMRATRC